ncbi:MAG TPA: helix-turn-helix domain-containing protein [Acidimicrobiales bacterium]|nr:helix-turn-helix domain-containing protein [Acidimicrobiales bacterium]
MRRGAAGGAARPGVGPADRALASAAEVVGDRWSLLVVSRLLRGPRRFGELLDELDGLAPNILSRRLERLEADGLVVGEPYSTRPVRHAYRLTAPGTELGGALRMLAGWAASSQGARPGQTEGVPVHGACGSPLEVRWFCATCDRVVDDPSPVGEPPDDDLTWV